MATDIAAVTDVARRMLPQAAVITDRARLRTYECDGLAHYRVAANPVSAPSSSPDPSLNHSGS